MPDTLREAASAAQAARDHAVFRITRLTGITTKRAASGLWPTRTSRKPSVVSSSRTKTATRRPCQHEAVVEPSARWRCWEPPPPRITLPHRRPAEAHRVLQSTPSSKPRDKGNRSNDDIQEQRGDEPRRPRAGPFRKAGASSISPADRSSTHDRIGTGTAGRGKAPHPARR